jgi:acyl carrier protein
MQHLQEIKNILADVLGVKDRISTMDENSALLGSIPEFDSMAVIAVLTALEEHFGISVEDDEIGASTFETLGTLVQFIEQKLAA